MADATLPDVSKELLNKRLPILPREDITTAGPGNGLKPTWRRSSLAGWSVLVGFFVLFGGWSIVAPLASGVHAPGELRVVSERQVVQHPDGGIVKDLLVREGDTVEKDEILMRLDPLQTNSEFARLENQLNAVRAERARLEAVRDRQSSITFPEELLKKASDPEVSHLMEMERKVFEAEQRSIDNISKLIDERIAQLESQITGSKTRLDSTLNQMKIIDEELAGVQQLYDKGLERKPRLLSLQRAKEQLRGTAGQLESAIAQSQQSIGEQKLRMSSIETEHRDKTAAALRANSIRLQDLQQNESVWKDRVARIEIRSPADGQIVDLRKHTEGGVVGAGEVIMSVVPAHDELIGVVKIKPKDIDALMIGVPVQLMLSYFNPRTTPPVDGILTSVSLDAITDPRGQEFFEARILIDPASLKINIPDAQLTAGMQVSALISVGERTLFEYWMTPLLSSLHQAMREP